MNTCGQPRCGGRSYASPVTHPNNDWSMEHFALAMAYVPMQHFKNVYDLNEALSCGTIFPELNKPFMGWKGGRSC